MPDFTGTQTGRIHEGNNRFEAKVLNRRDKDPGIFLGRDKRKIGIKPALWKLGIHPGFVKDVDREETELCNRSINSAVRKVTVVLEPSDKIP